MNTLNVLVLPGDGIGPEVTTQALRVLRAVCQRGELDLVTEEAPFGGAALDDCGLPVSQATLDSAAQADAVLLGAVGGPKWDDLPMDKRPERGLLGIRATLQLYANLRPATLYGPLAEACPLVPERRQIDFIVVRELVGGIYFGTPRGVDGAGDERVGYNTMRYSVPEVRRIARVAFDLAKRRKGRLASADKANVLDVMALWRDVVSDLGRREYADVALSHYYVDNCAMQLILNPGQFDVLLAGNLFGDILSDAAAALTGSIGMLPSASLGDGTALYEPVHGSAPDIAGQGKANPLAAILSAAMLLEHSAERPDLARLIEDAVEATLRDGLRTADIAAGPTGRANAVNTQAMGDAVLAHIEAA
jgi:3-isopropylmalate dehydrogenase